MSPPEIEVLSDYDQERQSALKEEAAEALEVGDHDLALDKLTAAIVLGCASAKMYSRRAQLLLRSGRPLAAVNDCTAAVLIDPDSAAAYKTRGKALKQLEQWEDSAADFAQALELDYDEAIYEESLEVEHRRSGAEEPVAVGEAAEAPKDDLFPPMPPLDVYELSQEALDEQAGLRQDCFDALEDGESDVALEKISAAIAMGCATAQMHCTRAELLLVLERPLAAAADCAAALAARPECAFAPLSIRGKAYASLSRWREAAPDLKAAMALSPEDEGLREEASWAMRLAGMAMEEELRPGEEEPFPPLSPVKVWELSEEEAAAQADEKQKCIEALEDGDEAAALAHISAAVEMGCATGLMYCKRAQVLLQLGRPRAAVRDCRAALALNAGSAKALKLRARAYKAMERWTDAAADYNEALRTEHDPVMQEELQSVMAKLKEIETEKRLASRKKWEIVGGADKGGCLVREGVDLASPQVLDALDGITPLRLATGAIVAEIELKGDRLHFQKLRGTGPKEGWISIALKDKVLAIPISDDSSLAGEGDEGAEELGEEPPFPPLAPQSFEDSEEADERRAKLKQEAADAQEDGELQLALEKLTAVVVLGNPSALIYCRRAQLLMQLQRPRAAVNDCTAALAVNPDSGKAFKIRARAHAKLKHLADAHADFQQGLKIDYDDETYEESLGIEAKMKSMRVVATEKRLLVEQEKVRKVAEQEKAAEEERKQAARILAEAKYEEDKKMRMFEKMYMSDQYGRVAWQQGYMVDFMGVKRGKSKKCPVYCWTPVRLSS